MTKNVEKHYVLTYKAVGIKAYKNRCVFAIFWDNISSLSGDKNQNEPGVFS